MSGTTLPPLNQFVSAVRDLFASEPEVTKRWERMKPLLETLLADPELVQRSKEWPIGAPTKNLLFYEDPDYGFVINGVIKAAGFRTAVHDHAHNWTLYGVLDGHETIERYERIDDRSKSDFAELRKIAELTMGPGQVDLVPPYGIHLEQTGAERAVAVSVRAERVGRVLHGRYDPTTNKYWEGHGPEQVPYTLK